MTPLPLARGGTSPPDWSERLHGAGGGCVIAPNLSDSPSPNPSRKREGDSFTETAYHLCGQCAVVLGWRPAEFWDATPAELACVLSAYAPHEEAPPDAADLRKLMEQFPDAPTGGE